MLSFIGCGGDTETTTSASASASSSGDGGMGGQGGQGQGGQGGGPFCQPGSMEPCYDGPNGTVGIGVCKEGIHTCEADGSKFGPCMKQVTPIAETCSTPADDDCDGQVNEEGTGCLCIPGSTSTCYSGPMGTDGVGICKSGMQTCLADGTAYGPCVGQVLPAMETCSTPEDDDCDGQVNEEGTGCLCIPGSTSTCYSGPMGTDGVGICKSGMQTCLADGTAYGPCLGEVTPTAENCATTANEDCLNTPDCGTGLWSKRFGDGSSQNGQGVAADAAGNVVIVGYFAGTVNLGGGAMTSVGSNDIFVAKFDGAGNHLWSKSVGNTTDQRGQTVAIDAAGNIYVAGWFSGSINFGGGTLTSVGLDDLFLVKLDANGNHVWSKRFGAASSERFAEIAVDAGGNVVMVGAFTSTIDFGGGALTSAGVEDIYLAKFDTAGNHLFSRRFGDAAQQIGAGAAIGPSGDIIIIGGFSGSVNFGGTNLTSAGGTDAYIAAFSSSGTHRWSKRFGDAMIQDTTDIDIDGTGAAYITGSFQGAIDFGGGVHTSAGGRDQFVAKFDSTGAHVWSKRFGDTAEQLGQSVAVTSTGTVFLAGSVAGSADFGGGLLTSAGLEDISIARFDTSGVYAWAKLFGDAQGQSGQNVAVDSTGGVFLCGDFTGTVDFGTGMHTSAGSLDIFLAKLAQ
ncbi:MAG TPA: hypothetical protein PK156_04975 [Polyangium sp.]|nr:hypothetical protein [Polyangium sp.]